MNRIRVLGLVLMYYVLSLSLGYLTSFLLSKKTYNFSFPLFKASMQNLIHFFGASTALRFQKEKAPKPNYFGPSFPCALAGATDIGLSSISLRSATLAFYTMVKSSSPVFILLFGFALGIEKPSITFFLTIFTIGVGVFLTSIKNTSFDIIGFGTISFASLMAGFRWAFVQYLIRNQEVRKEGILVTIRDLCLPISFLLLLISLHVEGLMEIATSRFFNTFDAALRNFGYISLCGVLSFTLLCAEFMLVSETGVVFLSVAGIVKELIIIFYAIVTKDITLSSLNYAGLAISIVGILIYNLSRKPFCSH
ncbi:uncharacterized protein Eint_061240 [Encephalitozoon intestinalis ATCC 50506]|uniref:Membrane protein n=1 Tax=Encephalitozoon intestinalis (strain ATCC 50506) TaxID=876142 RepID=E0S7Q1_ENCIT|nr:uncharacterized protein Eint_061240 [Encephalitozoon intestinalis ATCC 50506]ADM11730.1 putative membrane protein [Encephalitozoon intestinalis ATCC 50506]UTX45469.1 triose-phosphate transporter [Encephalitozoon intestinalis]